MKIPSCHFTTANRRRENLSGFVVLSTPLCCPPWCCHWKHTVSCWVMHLPVVVPVVWVLYARERPFSPQLTFPKCSAARHPSITKKWLWLSAPVASRSLTRIAVRADERVRGRIRGKWWDIVLNICNARMVQFIPDHIFPHIFLPAGRKDLKSCLHKL